MTKFECHTAIVSASELIDTRTPKNAAETCASHSIADILSRSPVQAKMAADCVSGDLADQLVINNCNNSNSGDDQPLDLSVDKNKCRSSPREAIKRKVTVNSSPTSVLTDHPPAALVDQWNAAAAAQTQHPHLQMAAAANFSTVLQYYLTAARLWHQNQSEVLAIHQGYHPESHLQQQQQQQQLQQQDSSNDEEFEASNDIVIRGVDSTLVRPESAATATPSSQQTAPVSSSSSPSKRRKKQVLDPASSGPSDPPNRPRKTRTTFTGKQLFELERIFEQKKYLSSNERQEVARLLNVTGSQIKIWFQNRRTKWKKQDPSTAAELAQLKSASRISSSNKNNKSGSDRSPPHHQQEPRTASAGAADQAICSSAGDDDISDTGTNISASSSPPASPSPV